MREAKITTRYDPEVEKELYEFWEESGFFRPYSTGKDKKPFCIVIPPPNITGSLHMGHALNNTIQDCLIRWKRMKGYSSLWMPGVDHAGIATQNVVEKELMKEGKRRDDIGREMFVEKVWKWKQEYGDEIIKQLRLLGSSCDWERTRFTMDEGYSVSVREEFVRLYEDGLIYRGNRIINWCPGCRTALSDIEIEHEEVNGKLYYIKYPVKGGGEITVATTRPETMPGDVAVAVNPDDERYEKLVGKTAILPLLGRELGIIQEERVDVSFGTGAVKITPAHDPDDFEIGNSHDLPEVTVIGQDGRMTALAGKFSGQDRYECRKNILMDLEKHGFLLKVEPHSHALGHCYRCRSVVEPLLSLQWFVKMKELAEPAIRVVEGGKVRFIPERWKGVYLDWMRNINDWCISRQIWWGHRLPVWYCMDCDSVSVERAEPSGCKKCGSLKLRQDQDVLDTWFSSALWPFAVFGWPDETGELKYFYPTSVLVTGYEIIYFWVARMIMTGLKFMGEVPFTDVYIHGIVRDEKGRKMSKSAGNVIDPREIIKSHGTDALRMSLMTSIGGQDIHLGKEKLEGMRHFTNKLWNAGRFILLNIGEDEDFDDIELTHLEESMNLDDKWILSQLNKLIVEVERCLSAYRFSESAQELYEFTWHKFCDWYLELVKPRLSSRSEAQTARKTLIYVWMELLKLLHPFMPFITEKLWQLLPGERKSIMVSAWPDGSCEYIDEEAASLAERKYDIIRTGRQLRTERALAPGEKMRFFIKPSDEKEEAILKDGNSGIKLLLGASELKIGRDLETDGKAVSALSSSGTAVYMLVKELSPDAERGRLKKELQKLEEGIRFLENKLSKREFLEKAPSCVVEMEKRKKRELSEKRDKLLALLKE